MGLLKHRALPSPLRQIALCTVEKVGFQDFLFKHRKVSKLLCFSYIHAICMYFLFISCIKEHTSSVKGK